MPTCPDWTVADLLAHIGRVHRWAAGNADRAPDAGFWPGNEIEIPEPRLRPQWVREGAVALAATLDRPADDAGVDVDPAEHDRLLAAPPGSRDRDASRRRAARRAVSVDAIDAELAADGIDEWLDIVGKTPFRPPPTGDGETLHFHCTDVDGEWLVRLVPTGVEVERVAREGRRRGARHRVRPALLAAKAVVRWNVSRCSGTQPCSRRWREAATF